MAKKRTVDQILNETLRGPSKYIYKKKWDEFKVFFGVPQTQWLRLRELPHNNYKGHLGGKVSQPHKSTSTSQSGAQAIASVFNFTKAPTTNNTTVVSQQDGERVTKIYNIHGSGENCNLNFY